jgi:hypothetical protein
VEKTVRRFEASVTYRDHENQTLEEAFPVRAWDYKAACDLALSYVLQVLKLDEFELRVVGA